ncbi:MgtC/SapB family protein [Bythopirellula goksoeyrii]|uniref:Putative Mg(2+) transport ATPase n=1 Tax=Bythopirellula goksoeyrii TaxID=1400387 RepID=A0A5B9QH66_9BACT|nr:MgtC/SapB family protein [Bythopirellula goksoeyrii]QEG36952.1 putative Mg(2+) transport ATPase [Bythopirellula goksoeyrii]
MFDLEFYNILMRIVGAAACGGILGWEREVSDKPAGLRTNMLVAIGAATATLAALELYSGIAELYPGEKITSDPIRIISGVIGGLGFLGAGAIIQSRGQVQGMTTAATIWVVGGIGVACGLGNYALAITSVIITFVVLFIIGKFEVSTLAPKSVQENNSGSAESNP